MTSAIDAIQERMRADGRRCALPSLTYAELGRCAGGVAEHLIRRGVVEGDLVAIQASRSEWLVPAMLGVWHAGAGFVILDAGQPAARTASCLRQASCKAIIGSAPPPDRSPMTSGKLRGPDDLAYVAFTSGSTGTPRGVVGTHGPVEHFLEWQAATFGLQSSDRFAMLSGLGHDPLLRDILAPLRLGATLDVPDEETLRDPKLLVDWLEAHRITVMHLTPTLGQLLILGAELTGRKLRHLRYLFFGGEALSRGLADACLSAAPNATIVNFYGATETPQAMGYHVYDPGRDYETPTVPVGRGIDEVQLLVESGEIVVQTRHLSRGYLNDMAATAERFGSGTYRTGDCGYVDRFGEVVFTRRSDSQVKIAGHRVEPAEVSAVMEQHSGILRALVTTSGDQLLGYFTSRQAAEGEVRAWLKERLPAYMIPAKLIRLSSFPMTRNGKIDVLALPNGEDEIRIERFDSDLEEQVARQYAAVLGWNTVGRDDHFFDLGGTSLAAARLMAALERELGVRVPLALLVEWPTPAALARKLSGTTREDWSPLVRLRAGDARLTPLFFVHAIGGNVLSYRELAERLGDRPCYALQSIGLSGQQEPDPTIEDMARRYLTEVRKVQAEGPYVLGGYSAGGLVAFEMAQQLLRMGETVDTVLLFDSKIAGGSRLPSVVARKMWRNCVEFFRLPSTAKREFLRTKWINTRNNFALAQARWRAEAAGDAEIAFRMAEGRYAPTEYPGRVILFRTHEGTSADPHGMARAWSQVARRLEQRDAPGNHDTMLAPPYVDRLAEMVIESVEERSLSSLANRWSPMAVQN